MPRRTEHLRDLPVAEPIRSPYAVLLRPLAAVALLAAGGTHGVASAAPQRAAPPGSGSASPGATPPPLPSETVEYLLPAAERVRIRGAVERVLGRTLKAEPVVHIVTPEPMAEAIRRSMSTTSPNRTFDPRQIEQLSLRQVALYDVGSKAIYLGSGGMASVGERERPAVTAMLFAQAVANAIIDQELSMVEFVKGDGPEVAMARRMMSEGFAITARDRAAVTLGLDPHSPSYRQHLPGVFDVTDDRATLERTVYGTGRTVVESVWNAKGTDAVWALLASKPSTVRELAALIPRSRALRVVQAVVDPLLTAPDWRRARMPAAPATSLAELKGPNAVERMSLAVGCLVVDNLGYSGSRGGAVILSSLRGKDAESTKALLEAVRRVPKFLLADLERQQVTVKLTEAVTTVGDVEVRIATISPSDEADGSVPPTRFIDLWRGDEVVTITITNARVPQETVDKIIATVAQELGKPAEFVGAATE